MIKGPVLLHEDNNMLSIQESAARCRIDSKRFSYRGGNHLGKTDGAG